MNTHVTENRWGSSFGRAEQVTTPARPCKPQPHTCPYCAQSLQHDTSNSFSLLLAGLQHLGAAIVILLRSVVRCVRFVLGTVLCIIGLFGDCCRSVGNRIAHRHDRRILEKFSL